MKKLGLLILTGLLLSGCIHNTAQTDGTAIGTMPAGEEQEVDENIVGGDTVVGDEMMEEKEPMMDGENVEVDYTLDLASFSFTPNVIMAEPGQTLRVKLVNVGGVHDFVIDELGVASTQLQEGQEEIIEINVPMSAAGQSYEFYCSVGNHRAMGMVGTLEVSGE